MRLLALEIKRVLKTKRTWILIVASVLLAVFMAYIPITFVTVQKTDESGNYVEITGKDAINYYKSNMVQGVVKYIKHMILSMGTIFRVKYTMKN